MLSPLRVLPALGLAIFLSSGWGLRAEDAERGRPFLEVFAPGDYHGHQQVFDIVQSANGFIYLSNFGEVIEYDGAKWRGVEVPTSFIRELAADETGRVWVGGVDELGWVEPGANGATVYHSLLDRLPQESRPLGTVWTLRWYDHSAWFATDKQVLRWRNGQFEHWNFPAAPLQRLRFGGRQLWLSRRGDGLYRWNGSDWQVVSRAPEVTEQPVNVVIDDPTGDGALLGTGDGRLWTMSHDGKFTAFASDLQPTLLGTRITGGSRLRSGLIAVTTNGQGVIVFDAQGNLVRRLSAEDGLPSAAAYNVAEDRDGGVWVGTSMGVARVELGSPYTLFGRDAGRGSTVALAQQRSNGTFYLGSEEGVRRLIPAPVGKARFEPVPGAHPRVFSLLANDEGLLVGTDAGLGRIVEGRLQIEMPAAVPVLGLGRSISSPDRIFLGFPDTVVSYRRTPAGTWVDEGPIAAFSGEARTLVEAADGCLWVGTTQKGFARVTRGAGQTWQNAVVEYFRSERGLPADPGWVRVVAGPGGPWFSTAAGVFVFDAPTKMFLPAPATVATKLTGMYTWPVASVKEGEIWLQVAASAEPAELERPDVGRLVRNAQGGWDWRPLPKRIIKQVGYFGVYEMMVEPDAVWLSGQSAVVRIETDRLDAVPPVSPLPLQWRRIARMDVGALPLAGPAPTLPYSKDPLRVEFAQPDFSAGHAAEYSYRLRGFNDTWSDWRAQPELELTALPAGNYTLEVRANNLPEDGAGKLSYAFRISPPWYAAPLTIALAVLAAIALVAGLMRWRLGALRRTQARLERLVAERTQGLSEATQRAETASRAKTMFLASVSHELRTPLHAILGYSQLLENDRTLTSGTRDRLRVVGASGRHLLRLINEVLDLSKIEAGKQELRAEAFNLATLLAEVADAQETRAHAKGLALKRPDVAGLPETVIGDASKLRQVLENLLGNAVKFTEKGEVSLSVALTIDGRIHFEVADTGPGIAAEEQPRLFQPFHQAGGERVLPAERGTGLGLAITQRLVALMGGEVKLASEAGHGCRFSFDIVLPAVGTPPALPLRLRHEYRGQGRRVLVVDDIAVNRELIRQLLVPLGFVVELAETAEEALAILTQNPVDLLILDLRLPGMSGLELARQLRATPALASLPILAASASALDQDPRAALLAGCTDFIAKPFLVEDLTTRVSRLLDPHDPVARGSAEPFTAASRLEPAVLRALHAAAQEGDVLRVREEIRRLRAQGINGPMIDGIERCIQAFDIDGVVAITAAFLKENPPTA